jgi:hypothetical protein
MEEEVLFVDFVWWLFPQQVKLKMLLSHINIQISNYLISFFHRAVCFEITLHLSSHLSHLSVAFPKIAQAGGGGHGGRGQGGLLCHCFVRCTLLSSHFSIALSALKSLCTSSHFSYSSAAFRNIAQAGGGELL